MKRVWPDRCPACRQTMAVHRMVCGGCGTSVEGRFSLGVFAALSAEQWDFLEVFLKCRANLREVERELALSYPTVRARFNDLLSTLGFGGDEAPEESSRRSVLTALSEGSISADEAAEALRRLGREGGNGRG